ncbi:hypothetical protein CLV86_1067 [Lacinutrix venerupis]|uniref:Outer membrane protein with beta-barrel domain n=1 Tax=Lacinutrix venerupis TaxID=1486034 RepID=A0AAC9PW53_9FLAO|nr:DUF6646 family protein [Lacinutrix venerupis]APX99123.1 hypothetical protein BWR22_01960 [Lacinutrix venerupis]RLJ65491.1 hypothetical protein CLV86_1067 [Lacinutrix venerupis]
MKKVFFVLAILSVSLINAQAFEGKGDEKFQIGGNFQDLASGLNVSYDYGIGENISIGVSSTYALNVKNNNILNADFGDRFDIKARFNANLGNVINIDDNFDVYPGLSLSTKNFGGHLGMRYFFTNGFGLYSEFNTPLAKYKENNFGADYIHNQFTASVGAVFNL